MAHKTMIATGPLRYGTRMLKAGDEAVLSGPLARLEESLGRFEDPRASRHRRAVEAAGVDEIVQLRADYFAKLGKRPFNGWDAATLKNKIAAA